MPVAAVTWRTSLLPEEQRAIEDVQRRIAVTFRRPELLREAMTHASWNNERGHPAGPGHDNERLEYLGDAVLELIAGEYLFRRFPSYDEGQLTQLRAALVNTVSLARLAERLQLGETLLLGRGAAKTGARQLPSLLANSFEAMIGAVFLDQGYRVATRIFLQNIDVDELSDDNFKGRLQEVAQERVGSTPSYRVLATAGPGHRREYTAEASMDGDVVGHGKGGTKQAAEQAAAHDALSRLDEGILDTPRRSGGGSAAGGTNRQASRDAAAAAGAARQAARAAAGDTPRARRRVAEAAADREVSSKAQARRRATQSAAVPAPAATAPPAPAPRRGLLSVLRAAADVLVGRPPDPPPAETPPPAEVPPATKSRSHRGRRGGAGRRPRPGSPPPS